MNRLHIRYERWWFIVLLLNFCFLMAQDKVPPQAKTTSRWEAITERKTKSLMRSLPVGKAMPASFRGTKENKLTDKHGVLDTLWMRIAERNSVVRIVHIGDSHVRGHVFGYETRLALEQAWGDEAVVPAAVSYQTSGIALETGEPGIVYHMLGINGATSTAFLTEENLSEISRLHPDLIIISLGTNEAHAPRYDTEEHTLQMEQLYDELKQRNPEARFLLTTPPGAYKSYKKGRRTRKVKNPSTPMVVQNQIAFAERQQIPYWNLYAIAGGAQTACLNWEASGSFQKDYIHFTHAGYALQGRLLGEAIIKSYNAYVDNLTY